jgi:uncharacterized membrane protein
MAAPALLSRHLSRQTALWHRLRSRSALVHLLASRRTSAALTALAAGEMVADKLPFVPPRTELPSLVGRAASGALCGAVVAARHRSSKPLAAVVGAVAAVGAAHLAYRLRKGAGEATGIPDPVLALAEDALVLTAGRRLAGSAV